MEPEALDPPGKGPGTPGLPVEHQRLVEGGA